MQNAVRSAHTQQLPFVEEVSERGQTMTLSCHPLLHDGGVIGSLVLIRDITDLRDREQLLLSKDATIAEIHHRVKNNLQTISSLLHLQTRRLSSDEAVTALTESVRRIRSIAVVHEILSHRAGDEVPFSEIIQSLVRNVRDGLLDPETAVRIDVEASDHVLPSDISTTLAVVLSELLQNTIDHAFDRSQTTSGTPHRVLVQFQATPIEVRLTVSDTGCGFPEGFDIETADGLGLTIVQTLVASDLGGTIEVGSRHSSRVGAATGSGSATEFSLTDEMSNAVRLVIPLIP